MENDKHKITSQLGIKLRFAALNTQNLGTSIWICVYVVKLLFTQIRLHRHHCVGSMHVQLYLT